MCIERQSFIEQKKREKKRAEEETIEETELDRVTRELLEEDREHQAKIKERIDFWSTIALLIGLICMFSFLMSYLYFV